MSIKLDEEIDLTLMHINKIIELVHAPEALEALKFKELEDKIEKCCPPPVITPVPCFKSCDSPEVPPYKPVDTKWTPIRYTNSNPK